MYRVVKTFCLDMAHRIREHKGKCRHLHGHTWKVEVSLSASELDEMGMVIDFGDIKLKFSDAIETKFDHSCILGKGDKVISYTQEDGLTPLERLEEVLGVDTLNVHFLPFETLTAERIAEFFFGIAKAVLNDERVKVDYVRVYESLYPNVSYAEYTKR